MSDNEFDQFDSAAPATSVAAQGNPFDQFDTNKPSNQFSSNLQSELDKTGERGAEYLENPNNSAATPALAGARTGFEVLGDYPKAAAQTAYGYLPEGMRSGISSAVNAASQTMGKPAPYGMAKAALPDKTADADNAMAQFNYEHPDIGHVTQLATDIAGMAPIAKGASALATAAADTGVGNGIAGMLKDTSSGSSRPPPLPKASIKAAADAKNMDYADGISGTIKDLTNTKNGLYSMADEVGSSGAYDASSLKNTLDGLHAKYIADSAYDATPLVRRLDSWKSMFEPDGSITPTRLNKLADQIDDAYKENPKAPEGEVYNAINGAVKGNLDAAKTQFPNWGKLVSSADDANYNLMKYTRDDGAFTDKWSPDSHRDYNVTMSRDGNIADTMGTTKRQINNITNIKDEPQLQKVMAFMPPEKQAGFLQDVANNSSSPAGIKAIAKGVLQTAKGNLFSGVSNVANGLPVKSDILGWNADASTHMSDRIAQLKEAGNEAYQAHQQEQLEKQGAMASMRQQYATQPRTLPRAAGIESAPTLDEELDNLTDRKGFSRGGTTPSEWDKHAYNMNKLGHSHEQIVEHLGQRPSGYAKGGAVNEPTAGQKMAGNYKKDHVKFHGLDISIENRKGSERSGIGSDGSKWKATMPDHYGYIKRTEGADGDHLDVYLGDNLKSNRVYVIDQKDHGTGKFDEHKIMLGYADRDAATKAYRNAFSDKKNRIMSVKRLTIPELKEWIKNGNTKKSIATA